MRGRAPCFCIFHPIRNLSWALRQVEEGRLETCVQPLMGRRRDEISDLGADFDRMAGRSTLSTGRKGACG